MVRTWCAFYILTWKCASRYSGAHFFPHPNFKKWSEPLRVLYVDFELGFAPQRSKSFMAPLNSYLRTRRFSSLLRDPADPQIIGKTQHFATFLTSHASVYLLSSDFRAIVSSLYLRSSDSLLCFSSSDSTALLCFFNSPYCRKFHF